MGISFKNANSDQLQAIKHINGPLLIIAGPGTGKTYTLINRALNLIINKKVDPSKILFVTFTEKASRELITRLANELDKNNISFNPAEMYIGTFHSICLRILKENVAFTSLKKNFSLYDQFDQQYFIYQHFNDFKNIDNFDLYIGNGSYWDKCERILNYINRFTEELIDYNDLLNSNNGSYVFFGKLMRKYDELRIKYNFLDFSSVQVETYKLLNNSEEIRNRLIETIEYVMVDEYQDTNHIQEKLTFLFGSKNNNICVVGDDDQAIYRFRGATVRNILEFPGHFKDCKKVELTKNYRSNKDIVNFYNDWMEETTGREFKFDWDIYRYNKRIISAKNSTTSEPSVIKLITKEEDYINKKTLLLIKEMFESNKVTNLNQIAFLFRSVKSDSVRKLAEFLEKNGIPVYSPRSNMFFERNEIKLIIGLLLLMFPFYKNSMDKLSNGFDNPMYSYYKSTIEYTKSVLSDEKHKDLYLWLKYRIADMMSGQEELDYSYSGVIYQMLSHQPFQDIMNIDLSKGVNDTRAVRNIGIFIKLIVKFEMINGITIIKKKNIEKIVSRFFNTYLRFLSDGGITEYEDETDYAPSGCVSFMTIHQSKGLEFPIVIVGSQSSTPRKQYNEEVEMIIESYSGRGIFEKLDDIKYFDFWRMFYVAYSRAQSLLILQCDASKVNEPSKYFERLYDILPDHTDFTKFKFETVKGTKLKKSYSFTSDINVYLTCPTQYKFFKELGFEPVKVVNTLFGSLVHETIEDIHKAVLRNEIETINEENIQKWLEINYRTISQAQNSYLSKRLLDASFEHVKRYVEKNSENWNIIKNAEMPISFTENNYIITGKVDLVVNSKGDYQILDFKTEKKPDVNRDKERMERVRQQLEIYAYLFEKRYGIKITSMKAYYTSEKDGVPYITFKKDKKKISDTIKTFDEVVEKIEKKDFKGQCSDLKVCKNCDLRHYCKRG